MRSRGQRVIKLSAIFLFIFSVCATAANRTASVTGNWSNTATWGGSAVPTSADDVTINAGVTVTVDVAAECATLRIRANSSNGTLTLSGANTLTVSGLLTMLRPASGFLCTINVNAGTLSCGALTMNATTTSQNDVINISTGTLTISGAVITGTTGCQITFSDTGTLNMGGTLTGSPTITTVSGSSVNYTGNSAQTVYGITYNGNLGISGSGTKSLDASTTVNGTLTLTEGTLENDTYLTMGDGSTISRSSGSLAAAPTYAGTVNLTYTGGSTVTTAYEMPASSGVLNNLTTNSGGVIQGGTPGATVNLLNFTFGNLSGWTGDRGGSYNQFRRRNSSYAGGASRECRYTYGEFSSTSYTASIYRMLNTTGYSSLNIKWKQFIDNYDADAFPYTIKVQCATSSSGPWTDMYSFTPTGDADIGPETKRVSNWTTNVGGDFYIRFYINGYTYGLDYWYFDDLVIDGQDPTVPSTVTVNGTLDLSNGDYAIEENTLNLAGGLSGSNTITGSTESNLSVIGGGSNLTLPEITAGLNNFTISRANGVTLDSDLTVNGILNLSTGNPSSSLGLLDTGTDTLSMAEPATTTGSGDVTGYVKRTSFNPNISYSFGNQYTDIIFASGGSYPDKIVVEISIGSSPTWLTTAINREYDFVQTGGISCLATISTHYLDSELNGLDEANLVQWTNGTPGPPLGLYSWGKSGNSTTENWVTIANVGIENFPTAFDRLENTLAAPAPVSYTWDGSTDSVWSDTSNWTPSGMPTGISNITIPDASTTSNDPTLPSSAAVNTIKIESGGILNSVSSAAFTINGANGAWDNGGGTFNPSTSNVIFTDTAATVAGSTDFYNLTVADGADLTPAISSHIGIGNALTLAGAGVMNGVLLHNTIEYNGSNQTVVNLNGASTGYHNLILSGTGTKTMPGTALSVAGSLTLSGSASATAAEALTIGESVTIGASNTFNLGAYSHTVGGDFTNNGGSLTSASASVTFNGTTQQTITNSGGFSVDNFTNSNTSASVVLGTSTNCSIAGDLIIDSGAVLDLGTNALSTLTGSVSNSGTVKTQNTTSTPVPSNKTWGGEFELNGSAAQTLVLGTYNDLTISGASGATTIADITVNGILNLPSPNVSSTQGLLHMGSDTLLLGPSSSNVGEGEVTGVITRTTILPDVTYTYGHKFTSVSFPDVGTLPTKLSVKLTLGAAPSWRSGAINRIYDLAQTGGSGTQAILYAHYLDTELNGNAEEDLVTFVYFSGVLLVEYGRSSHDTEDNLLAISNVNVGVFSNNLGVNEIVFDESELVALTWNGSVSTSWVTANNWTPIGAPSDSVAITIPDASTTTFDLTIPELATCKSITIESGGIINNTAGGVLTIHGTGNQWNNSGTFNPGSGTVVFTSPNATLSGSNDFHNIVIEADAGLYLESGGYLGLTGTLTNLGILGASENGPTTVEYKGTDQSIASSQRLTNTYSTLTLSGSGTKTLPSVPMEILVDMTLSGTASALVDTSITIDGDLEIGSGTTLTTGAHTLSLLGDFSNNGTLTSTGSNISFAGTLEQAFDGSSATSFDSITIDNAAGVTFDSDALSTVTGALTINSGSKFILPATRQLTVTGTLTNDADSSGLVIESDILGTGSLIHSTAGVEASVQRYMESDSWSIFSPAVTGQAIPNFLTDVSNTIPTSGSNYGMMSYSESGGGWQYYTNPSSGNLSPGAGYLLRHTSDDAVTNYGTLSSASTDVIITRVANGWNGIGNPFPCAIGVQEDATTTQVFLTHNATSLDPSYAALYLWDEPTNRSLGVNYYKAISNAAFTPSRPILDMAYLQPGQGFLVKSVSGGATVSFTADMRVHDNSEVFVKSARASWPGIILSVNSEPKSASTSITFHPNMTKGLDITYDAGFLGGDPTFRLYSRLVEDNGINFMLQCLPDFDFENTMIPIGFDCSINGTVSFSAETIELPIECGVFLEDRNLGIFTDLSKISSSYSVEIDSMSSGIGRFYLHLTDQVTSTGSVDDPLFNVYSYNQEIIVKGSFNVDTKARLIDLSGRILSTYELNNMEVNILPAKNLPTGIYILQLYGKNLNESVRIILE